MASTKSFRHLLLLLAVALLSLFRRVVAARRLLSFVSLRELLLHLSFLRCGLRPVTLDLGHASLHIWGPTPRRSGRKPALLLIHGFGGNSKWQWERQIGVLSRSFDLYIPDLVFFGRSRSSCADRSVGYQARCVAEAMRLLGAARYSVMGISYGGFVAFRLAEMEAESVERVAILTAGICMTPEQLREMSGKEKRDVCEMLLPQKADDLRTLVNRSMYRPPKWIPSFFLQDFVEVMYRDQRKERVELLTKLLDNGIDQDPVPVLTQDTLILWGDKDAIFPLQLAHQLQRHLGEKAKLEVIKDAGHALQLEKAEKVNYFIEKFLMSEPAKKHCSFS
ncbi:uncharacterized protein LOC141839025 [Curcuma longa]|uniref:uncharacterized protein LOC141839025 n=1 Tax=Curcuma longa TaxID=136217 RepID=UPI003D9F658E